MCAGDLHLTCRSARCMPSSARDSAGYDSRCKRQRMWKNFTYETISIGIASAICASRANNYSDLTDAAELLRAPKKLDNARLKKRLVNGTEEQTLR